MQSLAKFDKIVKGPHYTLEADESFAGGSNGEFVTSLPAFPETSAGRGALKSTMKDITALAAHLSRPAVHEASSLVGVGKAALNAPTDASIIAESFGPLRANPQSTVAISLEAIPALIQEMTAKQVTESEKDFRKREPGKKALGGQLLGTNALTPAPGQADTGLATFSANPPVGLALPLPPNFGSDKLTGLLGVVVSYLKSADTANAQSYVKGIAPLMARTSFWAMFERLPVAEKTYLRQNNGAPFATLALGSAGVAGAVPVLRGGISTPNPADRYKLSGVTRQLWLEQMTQGVDLLSTVGFAAHFGVAPTHADAKEFESMGKLGPKFETVGKGSENGEDAAPIFELRRMQKDVPYTDWLPLALGVFDFVKMLNKGKTGHYKPKKR